MGKLSLTTIKIDSIAWDRDDFCCRYTLHDKQLFDSIKREGILSPPLVFLENNEYIIVAGYKRVWCARQLKKKTLTVLVLPHKAMRRELFFIALESNVQSSFSDADKVRALIKARDVYGCTIKELTEGVAPLIGLPLSSKVVNVYLAADSLVAPIKKMLDDGKIQFKGACSLLSYSADEQMVFYHEILSRCFFSASDLKMVSELLRAVIFRKNCSLSGYCARKNVRQIVRARRKTPLERGGLLIRLLKEERYPQLSALRSSFDRIKKTAGLPNNITLHDPGTFESGSYDLGIRFSSQKELHMALNLLKQKADTVSAIFDIDKTLKF